MPYQQHLKKRNRLAEIAVRGGRPGSRVSRTRNKKEHKPWRTTAPGKSQEGERVRWGGGGVASGLEGGGQSAPATDRPQQGLERGGEGVVVPPRGLCSLPEGSCCTTSSPRRGVPFAVAGWFGTGKRLEPSPYRWNFAKENQLSPKFVSNFQ